MAGKPAHFVDLERVDVELVLDVTTGKATVAARIDLDMPERGLPIFDLDHDIASLRVDGIDHPIEMLGRTRDPDCESEVRVLATPLEPGRHTVEVRYELPSSDYLAFDSEGNERKLCAAPADRRPSASSTAQSLSTAPVTTGCPTSDS